MGRCRSLYATHILVVLNFFMDLNCCATESIVHVGVVLDLNSPMGSMADLCMKIALSDFYKAHPNYTTRLQLHSKNAESVFDVNFAVVDLVKHDEVDGIVGQQKETENSFVAELGEKIHVPVISFTARSSTLSQTDNQYFVRTTIDDAAQIQALAAIFQGFEWSEIVVLYEDTYEGNQFLSHLNKALQDVDVGLAYMLVIPTSATDDYLTKELEKITRKQTRVFLVHMNPALGYRLFTLAKGVGVMSEGYAWIISDSLSSFMDSMDSVYRDSMEGVLGVRPYVYPSMEVRDFQKMWKRNMLLANNASSIPELNVYGLWAYDTVTALAIAVEKIGPVNSTSLYENTTKYGTNGTLLNVSTLGPVLLDELSRTSFRGLSGDFQLVNRKLKQSTFEIFNVYGSGEKTVGFWTPDKGICRELSSGGDGTYSTSTKELKNVMWPGDSLVKPRGWAIPAIGNLRVGIPWKYGFTEFVNATFDPATNHTSATGFAIDIFVNSLNLLPFSINYTLYHFNDTKNGNWTYDEMLNEIPENFDMVVGDTTIWSPRANHVDFSQPYSESGVILVVKNKKPFDMWIFIKPFRWDLWLTIIVSCVMMGIVLHILEQRVAKNGEDSIMANNERHGSVYMFPVAVLAFPERNMVSNKWSLYVLVFWLFMAFILMQAYTANLAAILTVDELNFSFSDNYYVGCQEGSFMREYLTKQMHLDGSRLKTYSSAEEYHVAMSLGSKNGGIDAIFDEIPYMKIFLRKYDSQYKMVGPTYRTGGFGFAFPICSPLVSHFSKAILNVTQSSGMTALEQKNFGPGYSSQDPLSSTISQGASSLTIYEFAGLFLIIGSVTIFSLFCSETAIGREFTKKIVRLFNKYFAKQNGAGAGAGAGAGPDEGNGEEIHGSMQNDVNAPPPGDEHVAEAVLDHNDEHEIVQTDETSTPRGLGDGSDSNMATRNP